MLILTLPSQMWVIQQEDSSKGVLGYLTHYEDNAAFLKRKNTGHKFFGSSAVVRDTVFENEAMTGFSVNVDHIGDLTDTNSVWGIIDPRGFKVMVASEVIKLLVSTATIKQGVIQEPCVWGRCGGTNVLVVVGSDRYQAAIDRSVTEYIPIHEVAVGDEIITTTLPDDCTEVTYLGLVNITWKYELRSREKPWQTSRVCTIKDDTNLYAVVSYRYDHSDVVRFRLLQAKSSAVRVCKVVGQAKSIPTINELYADLIKAPKVIVDMIAEKHADPHATHRISLFEVHSVS